MPRIRLKDTTVTIAASGGSIAVKVADGGISWTLARNLEYEMNRGAIDSVVEGDDIPVAVEMSFVYEYILASGGAVPTPAEAITKTGAAASWVSIGANPCEPYAVNITVLSNSGCSLLAKMTTVFTEFRWDSIDFDLASSSLAVRGRCKTKFIATTRS